MDQTNGQPSASFIVEMEENYAQIDNLGNTCPVSTKHRNKLTTAAAAAAEDINGKRMISVCAPPQKQISLKESPTTNNGRSREATTARREQRSPEKSAKHRKRNAAERRQLRAQLRETPVDGEDAHGIQNFTFAPENLTNAHTASLESLETAEKGESLYPQRKQVGFTGEGLVANGVPTASTDSDNEISRNGDKVSTLTLTSRSSDESKKLERIIYDPLGFPSDPTGSDCEESKEIAAAVEEFQKSWEVHVALTDEESQNGLRFSSKVDPVYLGFWPKKTDKRKYLKAYPIIGPSPEAKLGCACSLPMTVSQWSFFVLFFVFFIGFGIAGYFYFRERAILS